MQIKELEGQSGMQRWIAATSSEPRKMKLVVLLRIAYRLIQRYLTYLTRLPGKSIAKVGDGSSLVTSFCISLALLRRIEARNLEKEPLRRVRPTHFSFHYGSLGHVPHPSNDSQRRQHSQVVR